ncbi:SRPBCC family protein [Actinomycetospora soli]|uniref:SRPBCC family protein n=1 Tax=Actinomycetospora soli TaxID=2893887 RepID=UPI001E6571EE|nr:SRPBCC family protein [Actinomycetospora soli]MCD2186735.1 SRPBCC family protein [Actinomycetospora soli]
MPRPYASGVVAAPVEKVWAQLRAFNDLPSWHPALSHSELVEGVDGQVGAVRRLTMAAGGDPFDERLITLDDTIRSLTYTFAGANPFGVRRYLSTVRVCPVTDTGETFVEWFAEYDADAAQEEELNRTFAEGVFATGIRELREKLT